MTTLADTLRATLSRSQLIELLGQLKDDAPLSAALFPPVAAVPAAAVEAPMPAPAPAVDAPMPAPAPAMGYCLTQHPKVTSEYKLERGLVSERLNIVRGRDLADMRALAVPVNSADNGYKRVTDLSAVPVKMFMPKYKGVAQTAAWKAEDFTLLFAFRHTDRESVKAALTERTTGKITMITAFKWAEDRGKYPFKATDSQIGGEWRVCRSDMTAPTSFWNTFKEL